MPRPSVSFMNDLILLVTFELLNRGSNLMLDDFSKSRRLFSARNFAGNEGKISFQIASPSCLLPFTLQLRNERWNFLIGIFVLFTCNISPKPLAACHCRWLSTVVGNEWTIASAFSSQPT